MKDCQEYVINKKKELKEVVERMKDKPTLVVVQVDSDPASKVYVSNKKKACKEIGINCEHVEIASNITSQEELEKILKSLNEKKENNGIILQLPIPDKYDVERLQNCISSKKDVDGFRKDSKFISCTPKGIVDWLEYNGVELEGKKITVLGRSKIVGLPLVNLLIEKGATVICCNSKTKDRKSYTKNSEIVISAIGKAKELNHLDFSEKTELVIDVGINRDKEGKLCGDVNKELVENYLSKCIVTPVPGGVGRLTVVSLLENVVNSVGV